MARSFENLECWKTSMDLVTLVYTVTKGFPKDELYGVTSQVRRAVVSVPNNIAEGAGRGTDRQFVQFINNALGSLNEVETLMYVSERLGYVTLIQRNEILTVCELCGKQTNGLKNYLVNRNV